MSHEGGEERRVKEEVVQESSVKVGEVAHEGGEERRVKEEVVQEMSHEGGEERRVKEEIVQEMSHESGEERVEEEMSHEGGEERVEEEVVQEMSHENGEDRVEEEVVQEMSHEGGEERVEEEVVQEMSHENGEERVEEEEAQEMSHEGGEERVEEEEAQESSVKEGEVSQLMQNIFGDDEMSEDEEEKNKESGDEDEPKLIRVEHAEEDVEQDSLGRRWDFDVMLAKKKHDRRHRRRKDGSIDLMADADDQIRALVGAMNEAANEDRVSNMDRRPAVKKRKMLQVVKNALLKTDLFEAMLDNGMISALSEWLAPLPDKSLPALEIRCTLLKILENWPNLEQSILKQSGLGRAVMYLFKHPKETKENKLVAAKLIREWSRPIFQLDSDFRSLSKEERVQRDFSQMPLAKKRRLSMDNDESIFAAAHKQPKQQKEAEVEATRPGETGFVPRARVPRPSTCDYVIRPKPEIEGQFRGETKNKQTSRFSKVQREMRSQKTTKRAFHLSLVDLSHSLCFVHHRTRMSKDRSAVDGERVETSDGTTNDEPPIVRVGMAEEIYAGILSDGSDFGLYQCLLFLFTQFGYLAVAPSMLSTTFFEPSPSFCATLRYANGTLPSPSSTDEFHSLLMEWDEHCHFSPRTVWMSSAVMVGAVIGAFVAGFVADRFGRKPVVVGSMALVSVGNSLMALWGSFSPFLALSLYALLGLACGAYMVTNMVLLIEILRCSSTRLLAVSLNGWPLGMIGTALLAFGLRHWRYYHLAVSITALVLFIIIHYLAFESIPWLMQSGNHRRAHLVRQNLFKVNSFLAKDKTVAMLEVNDATRSSSPLSSLPEFGDALLEELEEDTQTAATQLQRVYTYLDLFRQRSVCVRMLTLLFCFGASSVTSFGLYFSADVLPGSRYVNIAMMGVGKLILGFLPFILSNRIGRRPILLISVGLACLACWLLVVGWLFFSLSKHWVTAALGLFITAAIDPNWKIIHLLSMELFPTPVRNMSRALCNVVARLGSLSVPWVQFLRSHNGVLPFWLFGFLLTVQWLISFAFLPETVGQPLPEQMPSEDRRRHQNDGIEQRKCLTISAEKRSKKSLRKRTLSQQSHNSICSRALRKSKTQKYLKTASSRLAVLLSKGFILSRRTFPSCSSRFE
uniref:TFIIS N-terminal domain-containing protein n=1 Tax=Globodera rostochiensis TaxID=31243 RepID=A0A914GR17_GLORO